eukprot:CAMPEP_0113386814 /NCGR_PEP_ID=MMETSP0013_2-20120614/8208_1 /TAXON_ID=2843 ORGANISM="Skeletonema costatum, Strain 1716" /NCGR_SAMPLE_ID=MMETSP0013_2 /ASSEMBLY_ACC=CAM_ASM_000158 /LENGTH=235 /DNA_ID=CAMNT_0000269677 /DNA_START=101 /DNA_END=808 /DNA_ORIENTATION=+ /assembly_acc=CAM_ASM_000158
MSSMSSSAHQTPSEPHVPCHHNNDREVRSSVPPADWVNHTTVTEGTAQSHFEFFYQVIFTFVHSALTLLLAPVLKNTRPRSSSRRSSSSQQRSRTQRRDTTQSFHREFDPELAMPPHMTPENTRVAASSSNSSSILKSQRRRRPSGEQPPHQAAMTAQVAAATAKSVRFPEPKRSRPPLGRISSSIGSVASSANISVGESSSSSSSSSASSRNGRGRLAPRYTQRAHHTTYFLSD